MKFIEKAFPEEAKAAIEAKGGTCRTSFVCEYGKHFIVVLVSDDPSGENGKIERHLSVSASLRGVRRMPSRKEVNKAMAAAGIDRNKAEIVYRNMVVHVYQPGECGK